MSVEEHKIPERVVEELSDRVTRRVAERMQPQIESFGAKLRGEITNWQEGVRKDLAEDIVDHLDALNIRIAGGIRKLELGQEELRKVLSSMETLEAEVENTIAFCRACAIGVSEKEYEQSSKCPKCGSPLSLTLPKEDTYALCERCGISATKKEFWEQRFRRCPKCGSKLALLS